MDFNQNQDINQQFNQNQPNQFSTNFNAQPINANMQTPLNQQQPAFNPHQPVQIDWGNQAGYQQVPQQQQQFHMQQPQMTGFKIQIGQFQAQMNLYQLPKIVDPNATEAELKNELSLIQDNAHTTQKANLIADIKQYLLKQSYKKEIPSNVYYCIKALGIMKGSNSEAALKELKEKFQSDTDCLFSGAGNGIIGLSVCCCLCCFALCILQACKSCGNFRPNNFQQIEEINQLIDQNITLCSHSQQM